MNLEKTHTEVDYDGYTPLLKQSKLSLNLERIYEPHSLIPSRYGQSL